MLTKHGTSSEMVHHQSIKRAMSQTSTYKTIMLSALLLWLLTSCIKPNPSAVPNQSAIVASSAQKITVQKLAYVSDDKLWLTTYGSTDIQGVDACPPQPAYCGLINLRWSPDGRYLLYLKYNYDTSILYLADRNGITRLLPGAGANQLGLLVPVWSADGQSLIYTVGGQAGLELWLTQAPFVDAGRKVGTLSDFGDSTCGGGGFPASEAIYAREGVGTFPYNSLPLHLAWLANDILLYTRNCTGAGMSQFDLQTGRELPMIDDDRLLLFTTNRQRDQWAAITWDHHLAIGSAQAGLISTRPVAASIPAAAIPGSMDRVGATLAGGVFYGPTSGRLYYTTRQLQARWQIDEEFFWTLDARVMDLFITSPHFPIYQTTLFATTPANVAQSAMVWQGDAYGIGSVTETASGDILLVHIDNGQALYRALRAKQPLADVLNAWPKPQIIRIPANGSAPHLLLDNAGQLALSPPLAEK